MSAIFGIVRWTGETVSAADLARMDNALVAHGADGWGIWLHKNVGLGQRLRRFTPEDVFDRQPVHSADGAYVLVSDGRIDNRVELLAALRARQWQPDPAAADGEIPDSQLLLAAYQTWGEACVQLLVGTFVFAVWEVRTQRLLIVQPRLGQRSLVYFVAPGMLAFASMSSALLALPGVSRLVNLESIADYIARAPREPGSSFHRDIHRLDPSHLLIAEQRGVTVRRHWQPDLNTELRLARDEEYVDAFLEKFERVVAAHLRSATPVGLLMSGGYDSTAVASMAAPLLARQGKRLSTFTEVPRPHFDGALVKGRYADETPFVQAMAQRYPNLDLNLVQTDGAFYLDDLDQFFGVAEAPFRNASNRPWFEAIYRTARQQGVGVLLEGSAGNITFSWNGMGLLPQLLRAGRLSRAWREAGSLRSLLGQGILPFLPTPLWDALQQIRNGKLLGLGNQPLWHTYSVIRPEFARKHRLEERARAKGFDWRGRIVAGNALRVRASVLTELPNGAADITAGYRAWFGIEQRDPTGDLRLVEFCFSLPEEQYLRAGQARWLLRRAMQDRLPESILQHKARGLQSADWFERLQNAHASVEATLARLEASELAQQALDLPRLRNLFLRMTSPRRNAAHVMLDYRVVFEMGLMMGAFLCWLEKRA